MKLLRFSKDGGDGLGVLRAGEPGRVVPLHALAATYPTMMSIVSAGEKALELVRALEREGDGDFPLAEARLLAPIERPGKYLAIGMNYRKHIEEAKRLGIQPPANQYWFNKQTSCISGPFDDIDPGVSERLDYEVELGVVIGQRAKHVTEAGAPAHVFGYLVTNDVTARDWQQHSPTFTIGKSFDTHGPIGPWIVTADEIGDPHNLVLSCHVNGELRQEASAAEMAYNVWQQIAYLSTAFTLEPGDLLATGTPSGVGVGMQPPRFLQPGDLVRCAVDRIGVIENRVSRRN